MKMMGPSHECTRGLPNEQRSRFNEIHALLEVKETTFRLLTFPANTKKINE